MDGANHKKRPALQVIRFFVPSRQADDLLAEVYERVLKTGAPGFAVPPGFLELLSLEPLLDQELSIATGGRR